MNAYSLFTVFSVVLAVGQALAGTYYIAPDGSDSKGNGSPQQPWATIKHATGTVPDDGSTIIVREGLYVGASRWTEVSSSPAWSRRSILTAPVSEAPKTPTAFSTVTAARTSLLRAWSSSAPAARKATT